MEILEDLMDEIHLEIQLLFEVQTFLKCLLVLSIDDFLKVIIFQNYFF